MWTQPQTLATDPAEWLGDWHPLAAQLGTADGLGALATLTAALRLPAVENLERLREFLRAYHAQILAPAELPAILRAFDHTQRFELRELIAYDQSLAAHAGLQPLAAPSRRVGREQLARLRPLRDDRFVRRYLAAVEEGRAHGWHTLVYGLTLSVYSLPVRQGMIHYGAQTTRGFIQLGVAGLGCRETDCRAVFDELCGRLAHTVNTLLPPTPAPALAPAVPRS